MSFLDGSFNKLFLKKHGEKVYKKICWQIKEENKENYNIEYIELIFRIAFLKFCGVPKDAIKEMIKDFNKKEFEIDSLTNMHRRTINDIIEYLEKAKKETINKL